MERKSKKQLAICKTCNKNFMDYPYNMKRSKNRFCSRKCCWKSMKGKDTWNKGLKGVTKTSMETRKKMSNSHKKRVLLGLHNFWRGGVTNKNKKIRRSLEYKLWREAVFKRDNWTCQSCRKTYCELHPHHIKSFSKYPEFRFIVDNGITLCVTCHKLTDTYGVKNRWK